MCVYIVETDYVSIRDDISKILGKMKYKANCVTCREIPNESIHYEDLIIKYLDSRYNIDKL